MQMKHLYLLRHGQSEANAQQIVAGSHDSPLSELGRSQARLAGQNAKRFFQIDLIVSSPMKRALETAQIIASSLGISTESIVILNDLRERDLGTLEGLSYSAAPQYNGNFEDAENAPGIEPIGALHHRAALVLQQLRELPNQQILVVTHNGVGRMLRTIASGDKPLSLYDQPRLDNAIIYPLEQN